MFDINHGHDYSSRTISRYDPGRSYDGPETRETAAQLANKQRIRNENGAASRESMMATRKDYGASMQGNNGEGWGSQIQQAGYESNEHLIGPALIALGQPMEFLKPIGALGSKAGSSIASAVLRQLPGTYTKVLGKELGQQVVKIIGTNGIGASLGRLVPVLGTALTAYDFFVNIAMPMSDGNANYIETNKSSGNWIMNLPH